MNGISRSVLLISTLVSCLGGFLFGYDNIVISGAIAYLAAHYGLGSAGIGWAAGCALVGCLFGAATAGRVADTFGLRKALYCCAGCFAMSSLGVWLAGSFTQYVTWRIVGGVGIGAASVIAPMYIAEIAPAYIRGRLVVFYQLGIVIGILAAVSVNMLIERAGDAAWNAQYGWRLMFLVAAIPALFFGVMIALSKESPRWLMKAGRENEAERVLAAVSGEEAAKDQVASIRASLVEEQGGIGELFTGRFRMALLIGFLLAALSQTSGITAILSFLPEVFKTAGQNVADSFFQSVLVGAVNVLFTVLAIWLVDKSGRRTLILFGTATQTIALSTIGVLYLTSGLHLGVLAGVMVFVAGHAVGNGAVCWVIISEIFPTKVRGAAMSIATMALWIFAYLANQFFPLMQTHWGSYGTFFFFAALAAVNFAFVLLFVPETKGYSLEEISHIWSKELRTKRRLPA